MPVWRCGLKILPYRMNRRTLACSSAIQLCQTIDVLKRNHKIHFICDKQSYFSSWILLVKVISISRKPYWAVFSCKRCLFSFITIQILWIQICKQQVVSLSNFCLYNQWTLLFAKWHFHFSQTKMGLCL